MQWNQNLYHLEVMYRYFRENNVGNRRGAVNWLAHYENRGVPFLRTEASRLGEEFRLYA